MRAAQLSGSQVVCVLTVCLLVVDMWAHENNSYEGKLVSYTASPVAVQLLYLLPTKSNVCECHGSEVARS